MTTVFGTVEQTKSLNTQDGCHGQYTVYNILYTPQSMQALDVTTVGV